MLFFKRQSKQTQSRGFSMFDIPLDAYHPVTQLPSRVVVGGQVIQPLVEIQDRESHHHHHLHDATRRMTDQ